MLPSQIDITSVKIFAAEDVGVDVGYVFSSLRIRESIVHEFVSGDITIEDDSNLYESLPIIGQEQIQITINHNDINEVIVGMIYGIKEFEKIDARRSSYRLYFVSIEKYYNQNNRIARAFKNTAPHDINGSIFKADVPTKKGVLIESMSGNVSYIAPNITPFQTIRNVLRQCESLSTGTSNFLFFENRQGFIIASLASLFLASSQTTATLIFFPVPDGMLTTVLKFISFFFCLLLICKLKSIDSSNLVVQFFFNSGINFSINSAGSSFVFSGNFLYLFEAITL